MMRSGLKWISRGVRYSQSKRETPPSETHEESHTNSFTCSPDEEDVDDSQPQRSEPPFFPLEGSSVQVRNGFHSTMDWEEKVGEAEDVVGDIILEEPMADSREAEERLQAIMALKNLVHSQRETIRSMRQKHRAYKKKIRGRYEQMGRPGSLSFVGEDDTTCASGINAGEFGDFPRKYTVSFGPCLDRTDVEVLSVISFEDCDSLDPALLEGARNAVEEIRKQASQMEVAIALDELDTAKDELDRTKRKLELQIQESAKLKLELKMEKRRLANTEQERDLFEAEAVQTKAALDTYVAHVKALENQTPQPFSSPCDASSMSSITAELTPSPARDSLRTRIEQWEDRCQSHTPKLKTPIDVVPSQQKKSYRSSLSSKHRSHRDSKTNAGTPLSSRRSSGRTREGTGGPVHPRGTGRSRLEWSPYGHDTRKKPSSYEQKPYEAPGIKNESKTSKRLGLFGFQRQRDAKKLSSSKRSSHQKHERKREKLSSRKLEIPKSVEVEGDAGRQWGFIAPESQGVQSPPVDLQSETSSLSADELRKRLNTVSRFYENVVGSLQHNIVDLKTEKQRLEIDQKNNMASMDHENRVALHELELRLQQRDAVIRKLQRDQESFVEEYADAKESHVELTSSPPRFC